LHERPRIPLRRRGGAVVGVLTAVLATCLLEGCTSAPVKDPAPAPTPSLTQEQQDDEAFHDVMTRYVDLDANSLTDEDLKALLTGSVLKSEETGLQDARQKGQRTEGEELVSGFEVTDRGLDPQGAQYLTAQVCLDVSGMRLIDSNGADVTPEREVRQSLQVKAVKSGDALWRISDIVRNESVHACG
jgi:FlaG/FlaF family flagellin (archaellin)